MNAPGAVGVGIVLAAVAGAAVGFWLYRRSTLRRLRGIAEAVEHLGEPEARVPDGGRPELAALADAVNRSSARLARDGRRAREERRVRDLIFSSMQEGVLLVGGDGRAVFANAALVRHLGSRPGSIWNLFPLGLREIVDRVALTGEAMSVEVEVGAPARWLRGTAVPAAEGSSVLLVVRDVTEARQLDAVRRDFVANASHELKTPAASIQATAETILRAATDDAAVLPRFAEQLEREAIRLSRIVADLLDLTRLESGSHRGESLRLDAIVREETGRFEQAADDAEVDLEVDAPRVAEIEGSSRDLALLVRNLVDNAIRYTKAGGRVRVSVTDGVDGVLLCVADDGLGIPTRELPRIFERFYRVDRARSRETGGTGLGLAIVKHVAENHGGSVVVDSQLGRGTTIEIRIPRVAGPDADGQRSRRPKEDRAAAEG
jgi:two-component system, OmpR family, phosphate regulon sensor histidine kinase PhoR